MNLSKLSESLHSYERKVLPLLPKYSLFSDIVKESGLKDVEVMRAVQWLENKGLAEAEETVTKACVLDKNGISYLEKGLPELRFLAAIASDEKKAEDALKESGIEKEELNICIGFLKSKAAIDIRKGKGLFVRITPSGKKLLETGSLESRFIKKEFPVEISSLSAEDRFAYESSRKRKGIIKTQLQKTRIVNLTKLGRLLLKKGFSSREVIDSITPELIKNKRWKSKKFRRYDIGINVPAISGGKRHFVNQAAEYIKKIWLELGFEEMEGTLVQTSFWDLDALFVPQDHPARAMQDTFYIKDPAYGKLPKELAEKVKATHENGWKTSSRGWQMPWSRKKARENLMRTHTTVLSAHTISRLKENDLPKKFFSVAKVWRNEAIDWKHLFEFYQVEGIVADPDANLRNLIGYLKEFYKKMGFADVRVRPAHFPYTEPSLEVDVYHPARKEWVELGGAGIFRPEVVVPLLGRDIPVLAWGQGMERGILEYYGLKDLRDIYRNDIEQLKKMRIWMQ